MLRKKLSCTQPSDPKDAYARLYLLNSPILKNFRYPWEKPSEGFLLFKKPCQGLLINNETMFKILWEPCFAQI